MAILPISLVGQSLVEAKLFRLAQRKSLHRAQCVGPCSYVVTILEHPFCAFDPRDQTSLRAKHLHAKTLVAVAARGETVSGPTPLQND